MNNFSETLMLQTETPMRVTAKKPDYGIDAPGVVRNLILFGFLCLIGFVVARLFGKPWQYSFLGPGISMVFTGLLMLAYSRRGKLLHRDRMLRIHSWRGDEQVLDVGTGRGLLLIGAAKRLTSGHATGIDIWKASDLSSNSPQSTMHNLAAEGVTHRCTLLSEDTTKMSFADETFDVVLSNLCLHNIPGRAARRNAVREIARVLKPGGEAILSDLGHIAEYARVLRQAGMRVNRRWPNLLTTFPPLRIVVARKPSRR
jgi:SAM-dependent methyltransferase